MPKIDLMAFEALGEMIRPPPPPKSDVDSDWTPKMNPTQEKMFFCEAAYILAWGEKGSGKTYGSLLKVMKHAFEYKNAFVIILTRTGNMSTDGGAWFKLKTEILPDWSDGLGIKYKFGSDKQHNEFVWVQNQHKEWSMIMNTSAPNADQLAERFRGREPSMVFVDELTSCNSDEYFKAISAQLGRRPMVPKEAQQYIAATNPDGPDHWVWGRWIGEDGLGMGPDYVNFYCPKEENFHHVGEDYYRRLEATYQGDEAGLARMVSGMWVARASGDGLFRDIYNVTIHVRPLNSDGQPDLRRRLRPDCNYPMIIGLDPGSVFNAFSMQQFLPIDNKTKFMIFDEIVSFKKRISYEDYIPIVMRRMRWWMDEVGKEMPFVWISDSSAFNQYRAAQGSFDVLEIERIFEANRARFKLSSLKIKQAPKFNGSVIARTRLGQKMLAAEEVVISSACFHHQKMFLTLEGKRKKLGEPLDPESMLTPQRGDYLHLWDATSYIWLMASLDPTALMPIKTGEQTLVRSAA